MVYYFFAISTALFIGSCVSVKSQTSSNGYSNYREDLTPYRPKYTSGTSEPDNKNNPAIKPFTPQQDIGKQLNAKIDSLAVKNKRMKFAQGFRVLIYTGNSSEEVKKIRLKMRGLMEEEPVYDEFKQPTFRVKVGDCYSRLEAYYVLSKLQKDFPNAIVVPDQINIVKEK